MGGSGSFPIDLLLFGMIAAFLVLRLRGILGRKTGFERPPQADAPQGPVPGVSRAAPSSIIEGKAEAAARPLPDLGSPAGAALAQMRTIDRTFDPQHFLNGAEAAFRMIVGAFAAGDRATLRPLLSEET